MPTSVLDAVDALRQRFKAHQGDMSIKELEKHTGVNRMSLGAFVTGSHVGLPTLFKIEEWCNTQEAKGRLHDHSTTP